MMPTAVSTAAQQVHVFGIRHHGPGSAHSLKQALKALQPDIVLIEGPPDADDILPIAAQVGMKPLLATLLTLWLTLWAYGAPAERS